MSIHHCLLKGGSSVCEGGKKFFFFWKVCFFSVWRILEEKCNITLYTSTDLRLGNLRPLATYHYHTAGQRNLPVSLIYLATNNWCFANRNSILICCN